MRLKNTYQARKRFTKPSVRSTGMWYQSEPTVVPSNRITMKGPQGQYDYFKKPILGVGMQSGQTQVMQPGQEYTFPEDTAVYETMMQYGGHAVRPGETFYGIANKYDLTRNQLTQANPNLNIEKIRVGQRVALPERYEGKELIPGYFETQDQSIFGTVGKQYAEPTVKSEPKSEPKKTVESSITPDLLRRQAFAESTFNPKAKSKAGYMGLGQIGEDVIADYKKATGVSKVDPYDPVQNVKVQRWAMNQIYNAEFVDKPNQDPRVRLAKTLASYNWGKGNVRNYLTKQKKKGVDIYNSLDWLEGLPKETRDYVHKIQIGDLDSFNKEYKTAIRKEKFKPYVNLYQEGGLLPVGPYDEMMAPKDGNYLQPDINRPYYTDNQGSIRSEYKMGVNIDGKETLLPTVVNGRQLSPDQAIDNYYRTGLHMGQYDSPDQANYRARLRTAKYNMLKDPVRFNINDF